MTAKCVLTEDNLPQKNGHFIHYKRIVFPDSPHPEWLFLSGYKTDFTGTKSNFLWDLAQKTGNSCTLFEYFGCGESSGKFEEATIGTWKDNALSILDAMTQGPQILIGSSMGGWIMALLLKERPERFARAVGIAVAPDFSEDLFYNKLTLEAKEQLLTTGLAELMRPSGPLILTRPFVEEGRNHLVLESVLPVPCPVFLLHGLEDPTVPWSSSQKLLEKINAPFCSLTLIKDGDHGLTRPCDLALLKTLIHNMAKF